MSNSFPSFGSSLGVSDLTGIKYKDYPKLDIDYGGSGRKKRGSGIFEAFTKSLERKEDKDDTFNRAKALSLAQDFKRGSTKISDDATVVEGYTDPGFSYEIPGRRGFGDIIGAGVGAVAGSFIPGMTPMMGANLGRNIGGRF
mgnify:FL=1